MNLNKDDEETFANWIISTFGFATVASGYNWPTTQVVNQCHEIIESFPKVLSPKDKKTMIKAILKRAHKIARGEILPHA